MTLEAQNTPKMTTTQVVELLEDLQEEHGIQPELFNVKEDTPDNGQVVSGPVRIGVLEFNAVIFQDPEN